MHTVRLQDRGHARPVHPLDHRGPLYGSKKAKSRLSEKMDQAELHDKAGVGQQQALEEEVFGGGSTGW